MKLHIVHYDETAYWGAEFAAYGPIYGVYVFDPSRLVHLCELTPSYELHFVRSESRQRMPDDLHEEFTQAYADSEPVTYRHANRNNPPGRLITHHDGTPVEYDSIDEAIEDEHANWSDLPSLA